MGSLPIGARCRVAPWCFAIVCVAATAHAQTKVPRTPDGKPDFQGIWDFRTLTPLERPSQFATKETLSAEEVAALEQRNAEVRVDRPPRAGDPGTYNQFWFDFGNKVVDDKRSSLITSRRAAACRIIRAGLCSSIRVRSRLQGRIRLRLSRNCSTATAGRPHGATACTRFTISIAMRTKRSACARRETLVRNAAASSFLGSFDGGGKGELRESMSHAGLPPLENCSARSCPAVVSSVDARNTRPGPSCEYTLSTDHYFV